MFVNRHLALAQVELTASAEWAITPTGWSIVRAATGVIYCFANQNPCEVGIGQIVIVPPRLPAVFRASQIGPARLQHFEFQPDLLGALLTLQEREEFGLLAKTCAQEIRRFPDTHPAAARLTSLCEDGPGDNRLLERCQLLELVAILLPPLPSPPAAAPSSQAAPARFLELIQGMPEAELVNHSPAQLANLCGCSPRHFARLFRARFGVSVRDKQTRLRLEKARQLLSESDAKVIHVAQDSGYRHLGLFNSMFKKHFGQTPTELRRAARATPTGRNKRRPALAFIACTGWLLLGLSPAALAASHRDSGPTQSPLAPSTNCRAAHQPAAF